MLSQFSLWVERAGIAMDAILLLRIVMLKLPRTYLFISLFAVLSLLYDGIGLYLGLDSAAFARVWILSKFVYAIVFPLATWDLFEEAKGVVEKIRKLAMTRMISSLLLITLWGFLIIAFTGGGGDSFQYMMQLSQVVWMGSVAATLAFLWVMRRGIKAGPLPLTRNTSIWFRYFQLLLVIEALSCALVLLIGLIPKNSAVETIAKISEPVLGICAIVLTAWCVVNLRVTPTDSSDNLVATWKS